MSMTARFVEVAADDFADLLENSEAVSELFIHETVPATPFAGHDPTREAAARRMPQVLAAALAGLNPATRKALAERLESMGLRVPDLLTGKVGEDQFNQMAAQLGNLFALTGAGGSGGAVRMARGAVGKRFSLEKAWHGIHYLLCGSIEQAPRS